jgi:hypothetical protein
MASPLRPPDRDLASPIDQLAPVAERGRMRALPALSGRIVIAALERASFEVIRSKVVVLFPAAAG